MRNLPQATLAAVVISARCRWPTSREPAAVAPARGEFCLAIAGLPRRRALGVLPGSVWPSACRSSTFPAGLVAVRRARARGGARRLPRRPLLSRGRPLPAWCSSGSTPRCSSPTPAFRDEVRRFAAADPAPRWIVIAAEPVTDVDTTASDMLEDLDEALNAQGISLVFAELKDPVRRKIERYGLTRTIDPGHFFPTIGAAVKAFRQQTGADWPAVTGEPQRHRCAAGWLSPSQSPSGGNATRLTSITLSPRPLIRSMSPESAPWSGRSARRVVVPGPTVISQSSNSADSVLPA